jgi:periplasmic divalent cation tolerance protein
MEEFIIIYTTLPHRRQARKIAKHLIKKKLVACANIFKIDSIFSWKGEIEEVREYGMILKTVAKNYKKIEPIIKELHPYEVPCIVSWKVKEGWGEFLNWIKEETRGNEE